MLKPIHPMTHYFDEICKNIDPDVKTSQVNAYLTQLTNSLHELDLEWALEYQQQKERLIEALPTEVKIAIREAEASAEHIPSAGFKP